MTFRNSFFCLCLGFFNLTLVLTSEIFTSDFFSACFCFFDQSIVIHAHIFNITACLDIDVAVDQLDSKSCILTALADRKRKLIFFDDDKQVMCITLRDDRNDGCWGKCIFDKFCQIIRICEDIDLFTLELFYDSLYTLSFWTNACTDWIHIRIMRDHRHLCSVADFSCNGLDFNRTIIDFRNFLFK